MLPWQPKHHTISDFTKMAYSSKRAYSKPFSTTEYDNFKHILHNIHLQYKHKIIVFKIPDYSYHGNRNFQKTVLLCSKEILQKMKFAQGKM